jgi:dTDP-4-dehydrorhamnose reductase
MLGQDLVPRLGRAGFEVVGLDVRAPGQSHLDITRSEKVRLQLPNFKPDLVINCAAYTAVDKAELEPEMAYAVNRDGTGHLAEACGILGIPLMHLSTDYVFDGSLTRPYREDDSPNPLNVYGLSKWQGEEAIRSRLAEHLIVRTSWLYGVKGPNFVKTILSLAQEKDELKVVADQFGCPTWTGDLAQALVGMTRRIHNGNNIRWGTYHFCGAGQTTWYEFARAIVEEGRRRKTLRVARVLPISTREYPALAPRPPWSVLDCKKIISAFGISPPPWEQGLGAMLTELFDSHMIEKKVDS